MSYHPPPARRRTVGQCHPELGCIVRLAVTLGKMVDETTSRLEGLGAALASMEVQLALAVEVLGVHGGM